MLGSPIVSIAATPAGAGYWLVSAAGTVFAYGNVGSDGSAQDLTAPVVSIVSSPDGTGYWAAGADGNVYPLGEAPGHGSVLGTALAAPIVGMSADRSNGGYWLAGADGGVFALDSPFLGSMGGRTLVEPVSGIAGFTPA